MIVFLFNLVMIKYFLIYFNILVKIIKYFSKNKLYVLIHNLQYNNYKEYLILDKLFLKNLIFISKIFNFEEILDYILLKFNTFFIDNYKKFLKVILYKLEYIQLCQKYKIHIFNINDITSDNDYSKKEIYNLYKLKYKDQYVLLY